MISSWLGQGEETQAQPMTAQTTGQPPQKISAIALTEESQQLLLSGATHPLLYQASRFSEILLNKTHCGSAHSHTCLVLNLHWQERMDSVSPLTFGDPRASGQAQLNPEGSPSCSAWEGDTRVRVCGATHQLSPVLLPRLCFPLGVHVLKR